MFSYCTGGPFGLEDMVTTSGPGLTLLFLLFIPLFWCDPGLAGFRRTHHRHAGRRRLLPLGARRLRRLLGISRRLVELVRRRSCWAASTPCSSPTTSASTFPNSWDGSITSVSLAVVAVITYINVRGIEMVGKFATALEIFILLPVLVMVRDGPGQVASQSLCAAGSAASAAVQRVRRGTGSGTLALFRIRAVFDGGGRSGESAAQLSPGACDRGAAVHRGLLPADARFARRAGQLAELAHRDTSPTPRN